MRCPWAPASQPTAGYWMQQNGLMANPCDMHQVIKAIISIDHGLVISRMDAELENVIIFGS